MRIDPIVFPEPRYRAAVKAKEQNDEEKLGKLLNDAKYEDPTILVDYSKELKQTIVQGQGEHHLNILRSRILSENKIAFDYTAPRIPYRETITRVAQADYRHKKQSGGAGQFGEVHMIVEPYAEGMPEPKNYKVPGRGELVVNVKTKEEYDLPWGGKLQFYSAIVGGAIDARFMPAILKGIMEKMDEGPSRAPMPATSAWWSTTARCTPWTRTKFRSSWPPATPSRRLSAMRGPRSWSRSIRSRCSCRATAWAP